MGLSKFTRLQDWCAPSPRKPYLQLNMLSTSAYNEAMKKKKKIRNRVRHVLSAAEPELWIYVKETSEIHHSLINITHCVCKDIIVTGCGGPQVCETSRPPHLLDSRFTDGGEVVSLTCRPPLPTGRFLVLISVRG
jgi:hypothetical protein